MNVQEAAKFLAYAKVFYANYQIDEMAPLGWSRQFPDIPFPEMIDALDVYMKSSEFFPTPAAIVKILDANDPISSLTTGRVWSEIRKQIGIAGTNGRPTLSPVALQTVSGLGGWRVMCQSELDDIHRRLPKLVEAAKAEVRRKQQLDKLNGGGDPEIGGGDADA